ncbi:MAG TPA: hypothetical protein VNN62_12335 [Methylomirabilota bacterium]|nr:hypothetical protein [Methylomirabilota bacterium]
MGRRDGKDDNDPLAVSACKLPHTIGSGAKKIIVHGGEHGGCSRQGGCHQQETLALLHKRLQ